MFKSEVLNLQAFDAKIQELAEAYPARMAKGLTQAAILLQAECQASIQENQSKGRAYKKGKRTFIASEPGYPPNSQHGAAGFVGTIQWQVDESELSAVVGTNDKRGPWFEYGTMKMLARPWLMRAWFKRFSDIQALILKALQGE